LIAVANTRVFRCASKNVVRTRRQQPHVQGKNILRTQPEQCVVQTSFSGGGTSWPREHHIGIVVFDGCDLLGISLLAEAFDMANRSADSADVAVVWRSHLISPAGGSVRGSSTLRVCTWRADEQRLRDFNTIFVAAGDYAGNELSITLLVDRARASDVPVIYLGAPEGNGATFMPQSHARQQKNTRAFSAYDGLTAALRMIGRVADHGFVQHIAEQFLTTSQRALLPILADAEGNTPRVKVRKAVRWIGQNFARPISVTDIAAVAAMSERSLLRHFREEMGVSPSEFLSRERVECACRMLEETDLPVDTIASRVGTTSGDCMAKMFRRFLALSPSEYRQRHLHDRRTTAHRQSRSEPPVEAVDDRRRPGRNSESRDSHSKRSLFIVGEGRDQRPAGQRHRRRAL